MTLNEMAYALSEMQEKSDDHAFIERMKFTIINHRALLIRRDVARNFTISRQYQQSFTISSFEYHNTSDSQRSTAKLPRDVRLKNTSGIIKVQAPDSGNIYYPSTSEAVKYMEHSKFSLNQLYYYISEEHLHLFPFDDNSVTVTGIFEDPREVTGYGGDNTEFPIPADMAQQVMQSILSGEFQIQDTNNNQVDIESNR